MQLRITPLAAFDLEKIGDNIAHYNPIRAGTFVVELSAHCEKICLKPAGYRRRPELSDDLHSGVHGN
jgi:toxin ParE1/3/4